MAEKGPGFLPRRPYRAIPHKKPGTLPFPVSAKGPGGWRKTPGHGRKHDIMRVPGGAKATPFAR